MNLNSSATFGSSSAVESQTGSRILVAKMRVAKLPWKRQKTPWPNHATFFLLCTFAVFFVSRWDRAMDILELLVCNIHMVLGVVRCAENYADLDHACTRMDILLSTYTCVHVNSRWMHAFHTNLYCFHKHNNYSRLFSLPFLCLCCRNLMCIRACICGYLHVIQTCMLI